MVTTRSSGASEPLRMLQATPNQSGPSKRRLSADSQDENTDPKRARTVEKIDPFFMFPKKESSDDEDEMSLSAPPKSYADMIRRDRKLRAMKQRNSPRTLPPRRPLVNVRGQNPFGMESYTPHGSDDTQAAITAVSLPVQDRERIERSAAPEPETPKTHGLFGSLRKFGTATIGRASSLFGNRTPSSTTKTPSPEPAYTPLMRKTEPRGMRKSKPVWEIEYPELPTTPPQRVEEEEEDLSESEKKRRAYEAKHGKVNSDYDHLHTESIDGNPTSLPYPIKKKPPTGPPVREEDLTPAEAAFRQERKRANLERFGPARPKVLPKIAPLFGPDSHASRRTVDPRMKEFQETGIHPADREDAERSRKRKALVNAWEREQEGGDGGNSEQIQSPTFQPYFEDESESADTAESDPFTTPATKKQKTVHQVAQTPRSALKAPGSIGRSGRSVMFNANPVASVKRMTPPTMNQSPAGTYNPRSLFKTFSDEERDRQEGLIQDSPASETSLDPSPNTARNTFFNTRIHPGDALTDAINTANPGKFAYVWRDPTNPEWRPSLANPQPGTFRYVPEDEEDSEEERLMELERTETAKERTSTTPEVEAPQPPSTPRMSHAELPKPAGGLAPNTPAQAATMSNASASASASALEAANLERRRAEAAKNRPKVSSRLGNVTTARSRSPSPPGLDTEPDSFEGSSPPDSAAAKTPSPRMEEGNWTWTPTTNEYISSNPSHPDFAYNDHGELIPSFCLRDKKTGEYDTHLKGPDGMTESSRQSHFTTIYNDTWAVANFPFDAPQTYEEAGCGSKYIHDLIRENDARCPELVARADERFREEWEAHLGAIVEAEREGMRLVAIYPDRDGVEMRDD